MEKRLLLQVVIDQWNYASELRQSQPDGNVLRPVLHQQRHFIAMLEAVLVKNIRNTVLEIIDLEQNVFYIR